MIYIDVAQGSPEWHAHRAHRRNAGDAAAMLGCSPHESRNALLKRIHLNMGKDVSDFVQARIFDPGHRFEGLARTLAEEIVGDELYPVVGELEDTLLSASFDGLTMDESIAWEHKRLNDNLRAAFADMETIAPEHRERSSGRSLPLHHRVQMEHQMLVSGAKRTLFMASEWTDDGRLFEEQHCWYYPDPVLRQRVLDGWAQFEIDLAAYELPEASPAAPVGRAPETLPALRIELTGEVTASNLAEFKQTALGAIRAVNRDLQTDQDFANAEKATKWCAEVESRLKAAKEHALSQTASIDELFKALDDIAAESRTVRLDLEKLVTRRKQEVKEAAVAAARRALEAHIVAIDAELDPFRVPLGCSIGKHADFAGAIKGLRSVASMQDALDSALASSKIAADAAARGIRANVAAYREHADGLDSLFPDILALVHKAPDDFLAVVQARIAAHEAAEERRAREKAEAEEAARFAAQRAAVEEAARFLEQRAAAATDQGAQAPQAATPGATAEGLVPPTSAAPGTPAPTQPEQATLKLGDINARLAPIKLDVAGLAQFGIQPARVDGAARLYTERQFSLLCVALVAHITTRSEVACCAA
jgi:predicted phage-related endonuclease